jgi:hypothetical protein
MTNDERMHKLEGRVEMLRNSVEWMVRLAQTGQTEDDPERTADMPPLSIMYLKDIEKFGKDTVAWLDKHRLPEKST